MSNNATIGPTSGSPTTNAPQRADGESSEVQHPTCKPEPSLPYEPPPVDTPDQYHSLQAQDRRDQGYERAHFDGPGNTFSVGDCINSDIVNQAADLADNTTAQVYVQRLASIEGGPSPSDFRSTLDGVTTEYSSHFSERLELLELGDALAHRLGEVLDDPGDVDRAIETIENHVVAEITSTAASQTSEDLEPHLAHVQQLNSSSESRRGFLAELATTTDSPEQIHTALQEFGMTASDAEELTELLTPIQEFNVAEQNFLDGDSGPSRGLLKRDAFVKAERMLEKHLDTAASGLESLQSGIRSDSMSTEDLLQNPTVAPYLEANLEELGITLDPPSQRDAAGDAFARVRADGAAANNRDEIVKSVAAFSAAAALTATGVGGPLAIGLITSTALEMPALTEANRAMQESQASVLAGLDDPSSLDSAESERNREYAGAFARIVAGSVGASGAAAAQESVNAAGNIERPPQ